MSRLGRFYLDALPGCPCDDIGKVIFLLDIVIFQLVQPAVEILVGYHHYAGVDFPNFPLVFAGVLVFDYGDNFTRCITHNSAVTSRVIQIHSQ
jgi:hypothetical protein